MPVKSASMEIPFLSLQTTFAGSVTLMLARVPFALSTKVNVPL